MMGPDALQGTPPPPNLQTYAARYPDLPRQEPHSPTQRKKLTDAQKNTKSLARKARALEEAQFHDDLSALEAQHDTLVDELAAKHSKDPAYIVSLLSNSTHYKQQRAPTLQNALIHYKSKEINSNLAHGERKTLFELKELVAEDPDLKNLTPHRQKAFIADLMAARELKKIGARLTNRAAANDVRTTITRISSELQSLGDRTGIYALLLVTRGHIDDTVAPSLSGTRDSLDFFYDILQKDAYDVVRLFEQWACNRALESMERDTLSSMRVQCSKLILKGLCMAAQSKDITMNYANYDTAIVKRYRVRIQWPPGIKFSSPSDISVIDDIRRLRDDLKTGACCWIRMSVSEVEKHMKNLVDALPEGETVGKPRKKRSDAGKPRKRKAAGDESGNVEGGETQGHAKKRKKTKEGIQGDTGEGPQTTRKKKTTVRKSKKNLSGKLPPSITHRSRSHISADEDSDNDADNADNRASA